MEKFTKLQEILDGMKVDLDKFYEKHQNAAGTIWLVHPVSARNQAQPSQLRQRHAAATGGCWIAETLLRPLLQL